VSTAREVLRRLDAIGATIVPSGDHLRLRAGREPIPVTMIRRVREVKLELLALLYQEATGTPGPARLLPLADGKPGVEEPCAERRGRVQVLDRVFLHFCEVCGRFGAFGYGVHLRAGHLGRWYCGEHRPQGRQS
jgi:hypothetical protein